MINSPCKDCEEREIGCHSVCEKYQDYFKRNEERKQRIRDSKKALTDYRGYVNSRRSWE